MISAALVSAGAGMVVATILVARLTRHRPFEPQGDSAWDALAPRPIEDVERERMRLWPVITGLVGLALLSTGFVVPAPAPEVQRVMPADPTPRPHIVEVAIAAAPTPEPSPSPTPEATPSPSPRAQSSTATPRPGSSGGTGSGQPAATPTPAPPPGPSVSGSTSCFNSVLQIGYSLNARSGTTLSTLRVALDGSTVQQPSVSGRGQYSGNYQASGSSGEHTFTLTATASDGGSTTRSFPVRCS